jgi:hypothetical protein
MSKAGYRYRSSPSASRKTGFTALSWGRSHRQNSTGTLTGRSLCVFPARKAFVVVLEIHHDSQTNLLLVGKAGRLPRFLVRLSKNRFSLKTAKTPFREWL